MKNGWMTIVIEHVIEIIFFLGIFCIIKDGEEWETICSSIATTTIIIIIMTIMTRMPIMKVIIITIIVIILIKSLCHILKK